MERLGLFHNRHIVIGMLHLPALPLAPLSKLSLREITDVMLADAKTLTDGGCDGLMIENFGDVPFYRGPVPPAVVAMMTAVAQRVRDASPLPLGINVLRNDGVAALSIAHAVGASYVRINVLSSARVTDQGVIEGDAATVLRLRKQLGAEQIKIFADVDVKHSAALAARPIGDEVDDTLHRGLADALIVSGAGTGKAVDLRQVIAVSARADPAPVFIGSGVDAETIPVLSDHAPGFIVGTYFKRDGRVEAPVDAARVAAFMRKLR